MPRFFFDIDDGRELVPDHEGLELSDADEARLRAIEALPQIAEYELPDGDDHLFSVTLRNEAGVALYEATLHFKGRWVQAH